MGLLESFVLQNSNMVLVIKKPSACHQPPKMLALAASSLAFTGPFAPVVAPRVVLTMNAKAPAMKPAGGEDLVALAKSLNPQIGFWDR